MGLVCLGIGIMLGIIYRKRIAEATIGSAEDKAKQIVNEAIKLAETKQKEALIEAKDEIHRLRTEADREIRERRNEVQRLEKKLNQKEDYWIKDPNFTTKRRTPFRPSCVKSRPCRKRSKT